MMFKTQAWTYAKCVRFSKQFAKTSRTCAFSSKIAKSFHFGFSNQMFWYTLGFLRILPKNMNEKGMVWRMSLHCPDCTNAWRMARRSDNRHSIFNVSDHTKPNLGPLWSIRTFWSPVAIRFDPSTRLSHSVNVRLVRVHCTRSWSQWINRTIARLVGVSSVNDRLDWVHCTSFGPIATNSTPFTQRTYLLTF